MADEYTAKMDNLRREGQLESAARFGEMAGGAASVGLPSRNAGPRRSIPGVSGGPPSLEKPAVLMEGNGEYVYERIDPDTFRIAKSPISQGGQIITRADDPSVFALIEEDVAKVAMMKSRGMWDAATGAPRVEAAIKKPSTAVVTGVSDEMTIEAPAPPTPASPTARATTPASAPAPAPAATVGSPPAPATSALPRRRDPAEEFGTRAYMRKQVGGAVEKLGAMLPEFPDIPMERKDVRGKMVPALVSAVEEYRSSAQIDALARDVVDGLTRNGMTPTEARRIVENLKAQGDAGSQALRSLSGSFFDERFITATGRK